MAKKSGGSLKLEMRGDWNKAGLHLKNIGVKLNPAFQALFEEDGDFVLKTMQGHIDSQDLHWTPLAQRTVELKGGSTTIYVDTGTLRNGLSVRRIKSSVKGSTIFVGASPWKRHAPSGAKLSDLLIWLEYGTDKIPPRPLVQPTIKEVQDILRDHWKDLFKDIVEG